VRETGSESHDIFTQGEFKDFQFQEHGHALDYITTHRQVELLQTICCHVSEAAGQNATGVVQVQQAIEYGANGTPKTGLVTRGKSIGARFLIKY
jgi:hypothetical protein